METQPGRTVPETHRWTSRTHATPHTDRRHTHTHTHKETSTHSRSWGQRHSESPVRTHRPSDKHRNPERQIYTYTQIQIPDSQINTHTNASTDTRQDDQIITRSGAWGQTGRPHRDRHTDPNLSQTGTHTLTCGETGGTPARARRKDREVGGDEKTEVRPRA